MIYELTVFGRYYNQETVNRFTYVSSGVPAAVQGSFGLLEAAGFIDSGGVFPGGTLFNAMRLVQSNAFVYTSVVARAASDYDPEDFYERPFVTPVTGANTNGEAASPVLAYGFRTNRVRLDVDRGTKRFAGVAEGDMGNGGNLIEPAVTNTTALAARMSADLQFNDEGNIITYRPCIAGKQEYQTPRGNRAYRWYPTLAAQEAQLAVGITWQPYSTVRTQGSRQYGRGV